MEDEVTCPRCGKKCWRDSVHNGLAMLYGPWGCECGWSEYEEYDQATITQSDDGHVDQWGGFTRKPAIQGRMRG
jgi:hypothetical protein